MLDNKKCNGQIKNLHWGNQRLNWHCRKLCQRFRKINISVPKIQSANQASPFYHHSPLSCVSARWSQNVYNNFRLSFQAHAWRKKGNDKAQNPFSLKRIWCSTTMLRRKPLFTCELTLVKEKPKHEAFCHRFYEAVTCRIPSSFPY